MTVSGKVLVVGGAGYIGSHVCVALVQSGYDVVVFDNLCNGSPIALERVGEILGRRVQLRVGDIRDRDALDSVFAEGCDAVIHLAALKAVGESCSEPLRYFDNNIAGTITLLQAMIAAGVDTLVFSSSATVYGNADTVPVTECAPRNATNPYGRSKLMMEQIIEDLCLAQPRLSAMLLRYFNPVGAHPSGRIGEDPTGEPANLMPYLTQVAAGTRPALRIFGSDYATRDGTGVRDYLHVMDLAEAHVRALSYIHQRPGCHAINLGTGVGTSVLELIDAFQTATGVRVPHVVVDRRPGDVAELWADVSTAHRVLDWRATRGLQEICADAWRWQLMNPNGYLS